MFFSRNNFYWKGKVRSTIMVLNYKIPMSSYIVKENHIGSAVREILQSNRQIDNFYERITLDSFSYLFKIL